MPYIVVLISENKVKTRNVKSIKALFLLVSVGIHLISVRIGKIAVNILVNFISFIKKLPCLDRSFLVK